MESVFIVKIKPKDLIEIFHGRKYNIRGYEFLGIEKKGDFDPKAHPASEINTFRNTPVLYKVWLRHEQLKSCLRGTYKSWASVEKAIEKRRFHLEEMKTKYKVTIAVTLHDVVTVEAENLRDAENIVRSRYENGDIDVNTDSAKMINAKFDAIPVRTVTA